MDLFLAVLYLESSDFLTDYERLIECMKQYIGFGLDENVYERGIRSRSSSGGWRVKEEAYLKENVHIRLICHCVNCASHPAVVVFSLIWGRVLHTFHLHDAMLTSLPYCIYHPNFFDPIFEWKH